MAVNAVGNSSITMSIVTQAIALKEEQLQSDVNVALLANALDVQEGLVTEVLQSLEIGQNVDIIV